MQEKRQYVRMKTVFPVEFMVVDERGEKISKHLLQGFTRDVSAGGICIEFKSFGKETEKELSSGTPALSLLINPPFALRPIEALASVAWIKKVEDGPTPSYHIGIRYTRIDASARRRIIGYARRLVWAPRVAAVFGILLLAVISVLLFHDLRLRRENRRLVNQTIQNAEKKSDVASKLVEIQSAKFKLSGNLDKAKGKIKDLETKISTLETQSASLDAYKKELAANLEIQKDLSERLKSMESGQARLETSYDEIQKSEKLTASAALHQMYEWLKSHRNLKTGLVASYEGDDSLNNVAFTYDLSLVCQTFLLFGDADDASAILAFYDTKAQTQDGAFLNAYNTLDGEPIESLVHTGPNVWVGIAALQY